MPVKTAVLLGENVRSRPFRKVGLRGLSRATKRILARRLFQTKDSLFGADPWLTTEGLRDEQGPREDL